MVNVPKYQQLQPILHHLHQKVLFLSFYFFSNFSSNDLFYYFICTAKSETFNKEDEDDDALLAWIDLDELINSGTPTQRMINTPILNHSGTPTQRLISTPILNLQTSLTQTIMLTPTATPIPGLYCLFLFSSQSFTNK